MLREITSQDEWQRLVAAQAPPRSGAFLQSWEWGAFQQEMGRAVRRYVWEQGGKTACAQVVVAETPLGLSYPYAPRGPLGDADAAMELLRAVGEKIGAPFTRFEPLGSSAPPAARKTVDVQPAHTLIADLALPAEARSAAMHQKTRYNVRLAERKGVEVAFDGKMEDAWPLFETTGRRGGFGLHSRRYYEAMLSALRDDACRAFLAVARYQGEPVAANLMLDHGGTRTYLHGASGNRHREVMAPYLLHARLMEDAAARGLAAYDWWGIAPEGAQDHPWAGVTRFKLGFGGERVSYPGTYDLVLRPAAYTLYGLLRGVRRMI